MRRKSASASRASLGVSKSSRTRRRVERQRARSHGCEIPFSGDVRDQRARRSRPRARRRPSRGLDDCSSLDLPRKMSGRIPAAGSSRHATRLCKCLHARLAEAQGRAPTPPVSGRTAPHVEEPFLDPASHSTRGRRACARFGGWVVVPCKRLEHFPARKFFDDVRSGSPEGGADGVGAAPRGRNRRCGGSR